MMAEIIRLELFRQHKSIKSLATDLGTSPQNISAKLSRDNFSEKELVEIANALGCELECRFVPKAKE